MELDSSIYVAGHRGLVGSSIVRRLKSNGYTNLILMDRSRLDLTNKASLKEFLALNRPEYVFVAAAKVGGIMSNSTFPAEFIYNNIQIQSNIINESYKYGVKKLLFLGSSCIYPKFSPQPIKEEYLMSGELEPTNSAYAVAKIAGIEMCKAYRQQYGFNAISAMPTNIYGENDNFDPYTSHVIPALIRKFTDAKINDEESVVLWGDGTARREFLHADDLADACVFLMNNYNEECHVNVGHDTDVSIYELSKIISDIVGFSGSIVWDDSYPNGTQRKKLDNSKIYSMGWAPKISLVDGLERTIRWYMENKNDSSI
jgi:GDP-L-fucose synthase